MIQLMDTDSMEIILPKKLFCLKDGVKDHLGDGAGGAHAAVAIGSAGQPPLLGTDLVPTQL